MSHRSSDGPAAGSFHASRNTLPTPSAIANKSTDVMGVEEGAGEGPRVQTATHPSAQTVTPLGDEVALGPIVRDGPRGRCVRPPNLKKRVCCPHGCFNGHRQRPGPFCGEMD